MSLRELWLEVRSEIATWPGTRGWYLAAAMIGLASGFWVSVYVGPGVLFGSGTAGGAPPRPPGIVTVTVTASPPTATPTTSVPVAGERTGTVRRSSTARPSSGGRTADEAPAGTKGQVPAESPEPGPSSTTTTTTTTTSTTSPTSSTVTNSDDDEDNEDDE